MPDLTPTTLGEIAYTGYRDSTGGKTWNGGDMPTWADLPANVQAAWEAAGLAVIQDAEAFLREQTEKQVRAILAHEVRAVQS